MPVQKEVAPGIFCGNMKDIDPKLDEQFKDPAFQAHLTIKQVRRYDQSKGSGSTCVEVDNFFPMVR